MAFMPSSVQIQLEKLCTISFEMNSEKIGTCRYLFSKATIILRISDYVMKQD